MPDMTRWRACCALRRATYVSVCALVLGCASLSASVISVDGADPADHAHIARIAVNADRPVLLRAVDGQHLSGVHVSSRVRSYTYALRPGSHVLWLSNVPYGIPFLPQHLKCFVMHATLSAGATYELRFDADTQKPVLKHSAADEPDIEGRLVDEPFIFERGCKWQ